MQFRNIIFAILVVAISSSIAFARGGGNRGGSYYSPGTGAKSSSTHVRSYTKKNGSHVDSHRRSKMDNNFNNNWTTKGNFNPQTGKEGTKTYRN